MDSDPARQRVGGGGSSPISEEIHELGSRTWVGAEASQHAGRDRLAVLLLHTTHHHAEMGSRGDHGNALRSTRLVERFRDLYRQSLLRLQAPAEDLDQTGKLAETDDPTIGNVGDVRLAEEWEQVMLAEAVQLDIAYQDHLRVLLLEDRAADHLLDASLVSAGQE